LEKDKLFNRGEKGGFGRNGEGLLLTYNKVSLWKSNGKGEGV